MRKVFAYILLAFHVFTTGNFWVISNTYLSQVHALSNTWDFSTPWEYTLSDDTLLSVQRGIGDLDLQLTQTWVISDDGTSVFLDRIWRFHALWDYAYVSAQTQDSIQVVDISDPSNLTAWVRLVNNNSSLMLDAPNDIVSNGDYLYVAEQVWDAIQILDISDPANPVAAWNFTNNNTVRLNGPRGLDIQGDYLYVASGNDDALQIFDISNPTSLVAAGQLDTANGRLNFARWIIVEWDYAYMWARNDDSVQVIDISDPNNPVFASQIVDDGATVFLDSVWGIAKSWDYIYATWFQQDRIQIIDVSDPLNPVSAWSLDDTDILWLNGPRDVYIDGDFLVIANFVGDDVILLDISDPANPIFESDLRNTDPGTNLNGPRDIQVVWDIVYVSSFADDDFVALEKFYPTDSPTITANTAFNFATEELSSFTETLWATNEWSVTYQISRDNGTTWYYHNWTSWIPTVNGVSESNSASVINTNISDFNTVGIGTEFLWRAYLTSNGNQKVEIDEINVISTPPAPPIEPAPGWVDANLSVWLKADDGTSTSINGTGLNIWSDQSGNNLDATAISAPTYLDGNNAFSNFNPIIDFDGTDDYMSNLANGSFTDSYFLVIIPDNIIEWTNSQWVPFWWDCLSGNLNTWTCGLNFSGLALWAFTAAFPDEVLTHAIGSSANWRSSKTAIATYDANKPLILWVNENATANGTDLYSDWVQVNNASINTYQTVSNADYTLWRSWDNTFPFYYDWKIAEVINYSSRISDTERQQIESYLALKYGITLNNGTQNYIASDGSTFIWSNTIAWWYLSNIFGIGRDDNQELSQLKSKSINNDAIVMIEADWEGSNIAPSFIDIADREFLTISNNGSWNTWASVWAPTGYNILSRKWKSQEVWDTWNITLEFNVADPDFDVPSLNAWTSYYIVYDNNGNGDLSDETPIALTNTAWDLWRLSWVNIAHNRIFTLATEASSNNIPTDISLSSNSINENATLWSTVWVFSTTDIDTWDSHTYTFASWAWDDDNNRFSISWSNLNINHSPDHEIQETYTIRINTNDGNGWQYQESFVININDLWESLTSTIDLEDIEDDFKYTTTSGQWNKTATNPNTGNFSLESDNLWVWGTQSCFEVTHNSNDIWTIEFQYAVSSQAGSDFLRFYIDDVEQDAWSGTVPYAQYTSGDIAAWPHDYKWCYIKDGAGNAGTDNAFIDDINFRSNVTDTVAPTITATNFVNEALLPGWNHNIIIDYSDADSWINTATASLELYKWDWVSAYGPDISWASITTNTVTTTSASYATNNLGFGKYRYNFTILDNAGNSVSETVDFYIDTPEFTISTWSIDIGTVNHIDNSFSDTVTVTVRTVWAWFSVYMNTTSPLINWVEQIDAWDGNKGFGYDPDPFTTNISAIWTNQAIGTQAWSINTNWDMNVYTFDIKIWALIEEFQTSWDYEWDIDFWVILDY